LENNLTIILSPKRLRYYRKIAEKRQYEIAEILGIDRTTYNGYEQKETLEVPIDVAKKVSELLGAPLSELQKVDKVDSPDEDPLPHSINERGYIGLHPTAWQEFLVTQKDYRESLKAARENNNTLSEGLLELANYLAKVATQQKG
jgi:transcriptional regulator with XRE-family HTH domain